MSTGHVVTALRLGIETPNEAHIFMHKDCHVCRAEGFTARSRVVVSHGAKSVVATLYHVTSGLVGLSEAGLSEWAWNALGLGIGLNFEPQVVCGSPDITAEIRFVKTEDHQHSEREQRQKHVRIDIGNE